MLNANHEFEMIPAFTTIAGSSFGGVSPREFCADILKAIDKATQHDTTRDSWIALAEADDEECDDLINDFVDDFNNFVETMPDYCSLTIEDNEAIILPDMHAVENAVNYGEVTTVEDIPEYDQGMILLVNDHGNSTLMQWDWTTREYREIWSVV